MGRAIPSYQMSREESLPSDDTRGKDDIEGVERGAFKEVLFVIFVIYLRWMNNFDFSHQLKDDTNDNGMEDFSPLTQHWRMIGGGEAW